MKGKEKRTVILFGEKLNSVKDALEKASKNLGIFLKGIYPVKQIQKKFEVKENILLLDDDEIKKLKKGQKELIRRHFKGNKSVFVLGDGKNLRRALNIKKKFDLVSESREVRTAEVRIKTYEKDSKALSERQKEKIMKRGEVGIISEKVSAPTIEKPKFKFIYGAKISKDGIISEYVGQYTDDTLENVIKAAVSDEETLGKKSSNPDPSWPWRWIGDVVWDIGTDPNITVHTSFGLYQLEENVADRDWYMVEALSQTHVTNYESTLTHCGRYIHERRLRIDVNDYNDPAHHSVLEDYGPTTTTGTNTTGYTVGASATTSAAGVSAGYSRSWSSPDVNTHDETDMVNEHAARWRESFEGPDYLWYPWYKEPCNAAHESYRSYQNVICRVDGNMFPNPNGVRLRVHREITYYNDTLTAVPPLFILVVSREISTWTTDGDLYLNFTQPPYIDLRIPQDGIYFNRRPEAPDREVEIAARIQNAGSAQSGPFRVELSIDGVRHDDVLVSNMMPQSSLLIYFGNHWITTPGYHDIRVAVDPDNQVSEIIENNNVAIRRVNVFDHLIANRNPICREVHLPNCPWVHLILPWHRVVYTSLREANAHGYDNCYWCVGDSLR